MREILFKAKRRDNHEWIVGYYCKYGDNHCIIEPTKFGLAKGVGIIPETLGQFTGLTDKNGKRIFEGDIIKSTSDLVNFRGEKSGKKTTKFYEVVVTDDNSSYTYGTREIGRTYISRTIYKENAKQFYEVVGNRFDNHELLTAERSE